MMMNVMKAALILAAGLFVLPVGGADGAELSQVQLVYLLPMGNGMDQYIANQLTRQGVFQVVTDHQRADALFTDQIGAPFEQRLEDLYPPPLKEEKPETKEGSEAKTNETAIKQEEPVTHYSTFGRGKGNFFLVDRKSRRVIWSIYERPKDTTPKNLDRTAERIVSQLKKALSGK
jgi:hypothetical protein